jgi:hypothetical protein
MKKYLIGSIVGGIILFLWQGASWMVLGIHDESMMYNPGQESIMSTLSANIKDDGSYMMPSAPTMKERQEVMQKMEGKPWATVIYHNSMKTDMTRRLVRCILVDVFLVMSLIYMLTRGTTPIPRRIFSASVAFGLATWLWTMYMGRIWFDLPWNMIKGDLIDSVVAWALCGIWLGWWLNRPGNKSAPLSA